MLFHRWPLWLQWAIGFSLSYLLLAAITFNPEAARDPSSLGNLGYDVVSFPGAVFSNGLAQVEIVPHKFLQTMVPLGSVAAYFFLGMGIGKVREHLKRKR